MPTPFLLDTNAYYLFFQYPKHPSLQRLSEKIKEPNAVMSFYISELTSLEIHSVLGKYRREVPMQQQRCSRVVIDGESHVECTETWVSPRRKKMKPKVYRDILKLISDIESKRGDIQATVIKFNSYCIEKGQKLLLKYADRYSFSSHDALIAGTLLAARESLGIPLTLVTSDRGLKAASNDEGIPIFDPLTF